MKEIADETLMLQYAKGDVQAFQQLYTRHKNSLYRYFFRQTSSQDTAEELYQDVWGKLIKARVTYQANSQFTTWLYRIAHNELVDYYRRNATENKVMGANIEVNEANNEEESEHHHEAVFLTDDQQVNSYDELHLKQQIAQLKWCLKQLPREQKEAFLLKHEAGFTLNEIAKLIDEPSEGVKSRLRYGLSKLKHCVMHYMRKAHE